MTLDDTRDTETLAETVAEEVPLGDTGDTVTLGVLLEDTGEAVTLDVAVTEGVLLGDTGERVRLGVLLEDTGDAVRLDDGLEDKRDGDTLVDGVNDALEDAVLETVAEDDGVRLDEGSAAAGSADGDGTFTIATAGE